MVVRELARTEAQALLLDQIDQLSTAVRTGMSAFDATTATAAWLGALRGIEEFINIPAFAVDDPAVARELGAIQLDGISPVVVNRIRTLLAGRLAPSVVHRFVQTVCMTIAIGQAFRIHGWECGDELRTVDGAIGYFQSRRRQMVTLLYCMSHDCTGDQTVESLDALNVFQPLVERCCVGLTSLYRQLSLSRIYDDFVLRVGPDRLEGNYALETLDAMFLEPERVSITEIAPERVDVTHLQRRLSLPQGQVFSTAELCNDLITMEANYAEFELGKTEFGAMAQFIASCCRYAREDYYIEIPTSGLQDLMSACKLSPVAQRRLVYGGTRFEEAVNSFAPFIEVNRTAITTVTLLSRFAYSWKTHCLNRIKRFQIRSGFIFEGEVKAALARQGFVIQDIKRIERQEFDVVATLGNTIYNVQCKNNLLDLSRMEMDPTLFARFNQRLNNYFASALRKEEAREHLLRAALGLNVVRHVVLSKFPLATTNPRVMAFREINQFTSRYA